MHKKVSEIVNELSEWNLFINQQGPDNIISEMPDIKQCGEGDLVFVESEDYVNYVIKQKPSAVVTNEKLAELFKDLTNTTLLVSSNAKLVQALMRQAYGDRDFRDNGWSQVHDSAVIHESATIGSNVCVGPNAVISKNARIGENSTIMANAVIEEYVKIGADTIIHPNVTISYSCEVGDRCIIMSGTVIGSEGFGFAQDQHQKSYRVPQTGNVVLGDDVVLGANCTIDRATFNSTHIKDGCKFDNQVHIAHNTTVGEDGLVAAQCAVAGSTNIGKRLRCSGQTGILDHLNISDDCVFVQRAAVIQDVKEPGMYAGQPAQPLRKWFKNTAVAKHLEEMKKTLDALEKKVNK
ncbi:MAG: UDP-3-O-(3-hydroxymyristoyl)glucosamine N-acyltransferase [Gammaproteobacteria bacterium]|nr:MAG: UDP-3-O-(3-hydroxymyristoyl)glucosamine N-acyltransferase [Gammaproteobacteria bacterium]